MSKYGDTRSTTRLCDTCRWAQILKGSAATEEHVYCTMLCHPPPFDVVECKQFTLRGTLTLGEMTQIAHVIEIKPGGKIGFTSPDKGDRGYPWSPPLVPPF